MKKINLRMLIFSLILVFSALYIHAYELTGHVYENIKKEGIPDLVIKIKYPKALRKSEKITKTEKNGKFIIKDLDKGKYLLEVYDGTTIVYRVVIELDGNTTKEIELQKK